MSNLTLHDIMGGHMTPIQTDILLSHAQYKVLLFGRQASKSTTLRILAYQALLTRPNTEVLYVLKTYKQSKELGWRFLVEGNDPLIPRELVQTLNKSELTAELWNGSRIRFVGSENVDSLVGLTIDFLIMDETQSQKPDVWSYLQPMLAARNGRAVFAGTARGYDHFYDMYWRGARENAQRSPGWRSWRVTTAQSGTPAGTPAALRLARASMSAKMFAQEYEASPHALTGQVFEDWDPVENNTTAELDPGRGLIVGLDFNVAKMCGVVYQIQDGNPLALDEVVLENTTTAKWIEHFSNKYNSWRGRIRVYPDASGRSRKTSSKNTDHDIIRQAGHHVVVKPANPPVRDRINVFSGLIRNANGERRLKSHSRCVEFNRCVQGITWKNGELDKSTGLDHAIDAASYPMYHLFNTAGIGSIQGMYS